MKRGTKLLWGDMPGVVTEVRGGEIQAEWDPGYGSPFSGGTYWGAEQVIALGQIEVVGGNGHKPKPETVLIDPRGRDLFAEADQMLLFELS